MLNTKNQMKQAEETIQYKIGDICEILTISKPNDWPPFVNRIYPSYLHCGTCICDYEEDCVFIMMTELVKYKKKSVNSDDVIVIRCSEKILTRYLYHYIKVNLMGALSYGVRENGDDHLKYITIDYIKNLSILVPSIDCQIKTVAKANAIFEKIVSLDREYFNVMDGAIIQRIAEKNNINGVDAETSSIDQHVGEKHQIPNECDHEFKKDRVELE